MPDVFISYARTDHETAHALAEALGQQGLDVWWDRELQGGGDFALEIEQQLAAAPVVLVLWSPASVQSDFVRDESARAQKLQKLIPLRIADVDLPLGFGTLHTLDLLEWDGDADDEACVALIRHIKTRLAAAPKPAGPADPRRSSAYPDDGLSGRRQRRRLLGALAGFAVVGVGGGGAWIWHTQELQRRQAQARERLDKGLQDHFAPQPQLESAQAAYSDALQLDPDLARAHYFLGHLYAQLMLRGTPPPSGAVLDALRSDASQHFKTAIALAGADALRLDGSQRVIAGQQLALLDQTDASVALTRPVEDTAAEALPDPGRVPMPPTDEAASPPAPAPAVAAAPARLPPPAAASGGGTAAPALPSTTGAGTALAKATGHAAFTPTSGTLPGIPAPPAIAQVARQQASALFNADRDTRLAAGTSLTLDPGLAADALAAALAAAQAALAQAPLNEASRQGLRTTLALLGRASPSSLREHQATLQGLLDTLQAASDAGLQEGVKPLREALARSRAIRPVAYLQIAHERQRGVAQGLARRLSGVGYLTPAIEVTGEARAPERPSLRSQGASDPDLARWCQQALSQAVGAPAEYLTLRSARAATDTYELWFDRGLCAPGGRRVPACPSGA